MRNKKVKQLRKEARAISVGVADADYDHKDMSSHGLFVASSITSTLKVHCMKYQLNRLKAKYSKGVRYQPFS